MIDATDVEPVVKWVPGRGLVDATGIPVTDTQDAKARRYVKGGLIALIAESGPITGWGQPTWIEHSYRVLPLPGCKQKYHVRVRTHYNSAGELTLRAYYCECQRAAGTTRTAAGTCSHTLGVSLFRREGEHE